MASKLAKWRRVLKERQLKVKEEEMRTVVEKRNVARCFNKWRSSEESVQRERWQQEMSFREASLAEKRDVKLTAVAFAVSPQVE